jgi:hypothetical protein
MKTKFAVLLFSGLLMATGFVRAQDDTNEVAQFKQVVALVKNLKYQQGEINLRGGLATLSVPRSLIISARTTPRRCWSSCGAIRRRKKSRSAC